MKKYLVLLVIVLSFCFWTNTWSQYGEFGTSSTLKDTIPIFFQPWDSFAFSAPADTLWIYRYVLADTGLLLIDTYTDTSLGNRGLGKYLWKRRAFDGTHYGTYIISVKFRPFGQGDKYYTSDRFYTVANYVDSITIRRWMYDPDSTKYGNVGRNVDRIRLGLPTNFSSMLISSGGYVSPNFSDINGTLDSLEFGSNMRYAVGLWAWTVYATRALTGTQSGVTIPTVTAVTNAVTITSNSDITAIKAKTDKLTFNVQDSLIIDYSNVPTGSGLDSITTSRLIRRIVYGGVGNGSDSSTLAQRTVTLQSIANNTITAASINSGAFIAAKFAADYWALANWTGTWAQTQYSTAYWHNVALYSDSLDIATMAKYLGGKADRMVNYYNASGKLDSSRYFSGLTWLATLHFYRPTATSAPDSMLVGH